MDLFNITTEDEEGKSPSEKDKEFKANFAASGSSFQKNRDGKTIIQMSDPSSAYLGEESSLRSSLLSAPFSSPCRPQVVGEHDQSA